MKAKISVLQYIAAKRTAPAKASIRFVRFMLEIPFLSADAEKTAFLLIDVIIIAYRLKKANLEKNALKIFENII